MKLTDLEPQWILRGDRAVGIRFLCPINDGNGPHLEGHSVCVLFANPADGGNAHHDDDGCPGNNNGHRWARKGDAFETLTLSPSIDCTTSEKCAKPSHERCSHTHCWHGFVTDGEIR